MAECFKDVAPVSAMYGSANPSEESLRQRARDPDHRGLRPGDVNWIPNVFVDPACFPTREMVPDSEHGIQNFETFDLAKLFRSEMRCVSLAPRGESWTQEVFCQSRRILVYLWHCGTMIDSESFLGVLGYSPYSGLLTMMHLKAFSKNTSQIKRCDLSLTSSLCWSPLCFQVKKKQFFGNFMAITLFGAVGTMRSFFIVSLGVIRYWFLRHWGLFWWVSLNSPIRRVSRQI